MTLALVVLRISTGTCGPSGLAAMGALHGSPPEPPVLDGAPVVGPVCGEVVEIDSVGSASNVGLGRGVGLGSGVGGTGVAVGTAAWVIATMVLAAATAEAWMSAGSAVGVAGAHALSSSASSIVTNRTGFICNSPFLP